MITELSLPYNGLKYICSQAMATCIQIFFEMCEFWSPVQTKNGILLKTKHFRKKCPSRENIFNSDSTECVDFCECAADILSSRACSINNRGANHFKTLLHFVQKKESYLRNPSILVLQDGINDDMK